MRKIYLSKGKCAVVDDCDYTHLSEHSWYVNYQGYACREVYLCTKSKKRKTIYMHREILDASSPKVIIDHINRDKLDNRRANLRQCCRTKNTYNKAGRKGTSEYKGVCFDKSRGKWLARIGTRHLGRFNIETEAAMAYDNAAIERYGEYAYLNLFDGAGR